MTGRGDIFQTHFVVTKEVCLDLDRERQLESRLRTRPPPTNQTHSTRLDQSSRDAMHSLLHFPQAKLNVIQSVQRFLSKYGFRCINELKLEEHTLYDDPAFVIDIIGGTYIMYVVHEVAVG